MYGCALMSDGWTDRQRRGLINFLTDSPQGNFIFGLINDSIEWHDAQMLANLLKSKIKKIGEKNVVQVCKSSNQENIESGKMQLEIK